MHICQLCKNPVDLDEDEKWHHIDRTIDKDHPPVMWEHYVDEDGYG